MRTPDGFRPHARPGPPPLGQPRKSGKEQLRRFLPVLRPYRFRLTGILLLQSLGTLLGLASPFLIQQAIDRIFLEQEIGLLLPLTLLLLGTSVVGLVLSGISGYLYTWLTARVLVDLRMQLYRHLQRLDLRFYVRTKIGDLQTRMGSDVGEIQGFATDVPMALLGSGITLLGAIALLLYYSPFLFLVSLVFLPLAVWVVRRFQDRLHTQAREIRNENAELAAMVQESFVGFRLIKTYRLEAHEGKRFLRKNRSIVKLVLAYQVLTILASSLPGLLIGLGSVVTFYLGAHRVLDQTMTLGSLVAFGIYQVRLYGPIQGLFGLFVRFQRVRAAMDRVGEILDQPRATRSRPGQERLGRLESRIEFEDVSFAYEPGRPVVDRLSFAIQPGEQVALIGPSGVGKTTVLDLLFGHYAPESGVVRIDGRPMADIRPGSFLDQVAVVSQDTFLFHASLRDNIACGRPRASAEEIERAAQLSGITAFTRGWPEGLDTLVGERGARLSGGQRQRVSIARALLRQPRLLILDEATSQLDLDAERTMREVIADLDPRPTVLAVTHRVDQLESFDRILLLDGGRLAWEGTPESWKKRS